MLKIAKLKVSGFRGLLKSQQLDFMESGAKTPRSLVLYGLNSSGKTSFVDGIEWFLSSDNKIAWLRREEAQEHAYYHQEAKDGESLVEIKFYDDKKNLGLLKKTLDRQRLTKPVLSNNEDFANVYKSFVIKPYLRYLEVIDFVYNRTGKEKYEMLASWMGFQEELEYQEKVALDILPQLQQVEISIGKEIQEYEQNIRQLTGLKQLSIASVVSFGDSILTNYGIDKSSSIRKLWEQIPNLNKLKTSDSSVVKLEKLAQIEKELMAESGWGTDLINKVFEFNLSVKEFKEQKEVISKVNVIELYDKALDLLSDESEVDTKCPVCHTQWKRKELVEHIKEELSKFNRIRNLKDSLLKTKSEISTLLKGERKKVDKLVSNYDKAEEIVTGLGFKQTKSYDEFLKNIEMKFETDDSITLELEEMSEAQIKNINEEKKQIVELLQNEKEKVSPSAKEMKLIEDVELLKQIKQKWESIESLKHKRTFFQQEINKVANIAKKIVNHIQSGIKNRFDKTSEMIRKFFEILRSDKDIKDIKIVLNEERGRAAGRSAEIQLKYYDISVKPAYKVLSESLLNSLGLAIYFTCVKQLNKECKFIVLDDIMNSLDIEKRDTLLDLIEEEFKDFQIIIFTHDFYWFQKIMRRFPYWSHKNIKNWNYVSGPVIERSRTKKERIEALLNDSTNIENAGFELGKHVEGILNELCENIHAMTRYRYLKVDPPSMEELFDSFVRRLKEKLNKDHPILAKAIDARKYEGLLRNFVDHPRDNYVSSVSPTEIRNAMDKWYSLESDLFCSNCNKYIQYIEKKGSLECKCGNKNISKKSAAVAV